MNIKDAIALNNDKGEDGMTPETAKAFWLEKQEKALKDDAIIHKTYDGIKLIESLVRRDTAKKYFDAETQSMVFRTALGKRTGKAKVTPFTLWYDILDKDGKVIYSLTYKDSESNQSIALDAVTGKPIVAGKGWKQIRAFFTTEVEQATVPANTEMEENKIKSTPPVAEEPKAKVPVAKAAAKPPADSQEQSFELPDIPEELLN